VTPAVANDEVVAVVSDRFAAVATQAIPAVAVACEALRVDDHLAKNGFGGGSAYEVVLEEFDASLD